jgi:hypothetical protein
MFPVIADHETMNPMICQLNLQVELLLLEVYRRFRARFHPESHVVSFCGS